MSSYQQCTDNNLNKGIQIENNGLMHCFSLRWRLVWLGVAIAAFLITFQIGATVLLSIEQAESIKKELSQRNAGINQLAIFSNNILPSLEMFIPVAGVGVGMYSAYSTGQALSAFSVFNPILKSIFPLSVFLTPFAIMELIAYGLAISRSGMIVHYLVANRRNILELWKKFSIHTGIEIGIVILILFIGSVVEWQILLTRHH
jgi:hypothetical protein